VGKLLGIQDLGFGSEGGFDSKDKTDAPGFDVLIKEDVMKTREMVLAYHENELKAFNIPGLAAQLVGKYPILESTLTSQKKKARSRMS